MSLNQIDSRVTEVLEEFDTSVTKKEEPNTTELSSGVILRHKRVPPMILARVDEKYPEPAIPVLWDEEKERSIPNPDDPEYEKALKKNREIKGMAIVDVIIGLGTEVVYVPDNKQKPDEEEWVEDLLFVGIEVPKLKIGRYLAWVKYYAAERAEDIQNLAKKGSTVIGVTEEDVAKAIATFQSDEERTSDSGDST